MTDKETALALGEEINRLRSKLEAMEHVMLNYRVLGLDGHRHELPWRADLQVVESEESHQALIAARSESLQRALSGAEGESALFQVVLKNCCRKSSTPPQ